MNSFSRFFFGTCVAAAAVLPAHAIIERTIEKTFTVQPGGTLFAETQGGNIRVEPSSDNLVKIHVRQKIRADNDAEADELLQKLTLTIEQQGNDVSAVSRYEKRPSGFWRGSWPPVQVDFVVTVPSRYAVELKTSGGNLGVGNLDGTVQARTSGGNVKLARITGNIVASTSGGNVSLAEGLAEVDLSTSGGDITVGRAIGVTKLHTSGGNITIDSVENSVRASTSGGSVKATLSGALKGDCSLSTSGGNVRATVDKAAGFQLDASTSGGDVDVEGLTITIAKGGVGKSRLAGAVNGGGPLLKLRTSGGDIDVRTR